MRNRLNIFCGSTWLFGAGLQLAVGNRGVAVIYWACALAYIIPAYQLAASVDKALKNKKTGQNNGS